MEIVTLDEAKANEKTPISNKTKTWKYKAKNVRDFAWTASKKFVWDAMPHINELGQKVMCMSLYGKEAYPIYLTIRFAALTIRFAALTMRFAAMTMRFAAPCPTLNRYCSFLSVTPH